MIEENLYCKLLDKSIVKLIEEKSAKPKKTIKQHTNELLEVLDRLWKYKYIKDEHLYELIKIACIYHDIGKINKEFQYRVDSKKKIPFNEKREVPHNILSLFFINDEIFEDENDYFRVSSAVVNHHDYCNVYRTIDEKEELIKKLLENYEYKEDGFYINAELADIAQDLDAIKIKGFLHKCDYNASALDENGNKTYEVEYINDFLEESLNNLLDRWKDDNPDSSWNKLQNFCLENQNENIIAIAQTGMGKTEAGLLWIGNNKGFFILPIRTAINAIFERMRKDILNIKDEDNHLEKINTKIGLLHSSSLEYLLTQNLKKTNSEDIEEKEDDEILRYEKEAKQLSLPINISTLDQLFDFVYKYHAYELKLTTLSYSKIVIDEIQMYSPDLLAYLIYGIERIVEQGGKVAILTATLAPFISDLLNKNINFKSEVFTNDLIRHNLKVIDKKINAEDIYEKYIENKKLDKSNKILVVCNSISEAQNLYEQLKKNIDSNELNILHAKFIRDERLEKEREIIDFGKTYKKDSKELDKQNGIWISTSIVEASLDIDFDYLFTELQEINSLFQRLGRCNRKGKKSSDETNCYVYTEIDENIFINGKKGYVDRKIFDLSKEAIENINGQISENKKIELINTYMTMDNLKDSEFMIEYKKIYDYIKDLPPGEFNEKDVNLRNIDSREIIPSPIYTDNLGEILDIESKLNNPELKHSKADKLELQDKLKRFTVSVHPSHIYSYERALRDKKATEYKKIKVNKFEYIPVIDCLYDEIGYRKKNFNDEKSLNYNVDDLMV